MNEPLPMPWGDCERFSPCWCAVAGRQNNPNCKQKVPIESFSLSAVIVIAILLFILNKLKLINMKNLFERFYDAVGQFLFGNKPFSWGELKGL